MKTLIAKISLVLALVTTLGAGLYAAEKGCCPGDCCDKACCKKAV